MKPIGNSGYRAGAATEGRAEPDTLNEAAATASLQGQAREPVTVAQPLAGETMIVKAEPGAVYLLDFAPKSVNFAVEGDNIVMTFDLDGDGTADSQVIFLDLAGMAGDADAPTLLIAGVDYDVSTLLDGAETFLQARGLIEAEDAQLPGGPAVETEGGGLPQSGGGSQYQDDLGSTPFSDSSGTLSDVDGPLGADFGPGGASGTVITGLPRLASAGSDNAALPGDGSGSGDDGGGGGGGGGGSGVEILAGQVVDGYVASATVFRDANGNGALDDDEVFTTTDINGNFTLTGGSGPLVAIGGTDVSTGLPFDGVLKAPEGATVITPLTTLVQQLVEGGQTAAAAETQVKQALGIDAGFNLSQTDPVKAAAGGSTAALKAVKAGIAVANTATQVKSALKGGGATDDEAASNAAFNAIANQISANGAGTDLRNVDQVKTVINTAKATHDAATEQTTTFDSNDLDNAANVITATNTAVENVDTEGGDSATDKLTNLAQVAQVAQSQASDAIQTAVADNNNSAAENYDNATKVENDAAVAEVGAVTGSSALTQGADFVEGTPLGDAFDGLGGNDTIYGYGGLDAISGGAGNDLIYGGDGNDVIQGGTGNDTLHGDAGNDDIVGDAGNDLIFGGAGNDTLAGGAGNDTIYGGAGNDTVRFDGRAGDYRFDFAEGGTITVTKLATGEVDILHQVEHLRFANGKTMSLGSEIDISSLGSVGIVFGDLSGLTKIATAAGQNLQLDGGKIDLISEADGTLTIAGGAAVNIVNANLNLPNDGTQPTVRNLLALEFEDLDGEKSLIPDNLTVGDSHTDAFAAFWIPLDKLYVGHDNYYNLETNTSFAYLGNDYAAYLKAGGEALLDLVKVTGSRLQTLHDNLLGNLNDSPIKKRFTDKDEVDPRTADGEAFGDRPIHDGSIDTGTDLYSDASFASRTIGWDLAHGISFPDGLPAPYGVLDEANFLSGTAEGHSQTDGLDFFYGGGGNDIIDGGTGDDTAIYLGSRLNFTVSGGEDGKVTVIDTDTVDGGDEGSDTLTSIETLQFADGTLSFGATLARAVPEVGDGNDGFHPGAGNSDVNFAIHDNTEAQIEAALKVKTRFVGDLDSDGATYYTETGTSSGGIASWNFEYSIVDYGDDADILRYDIAITADFIDLQGNRSEGIMSFDADAHEEAKQEGYYNDPDPDGTSGLQNSQNIVWYSDAYDPSAPGSYILVLSVTDKNTGEVVARTEIRVEVAPNIVVNAGDLIQDAINAAQVGDTIYVAAGTYNETLTIDKQITLIGAFGNVAGSDGDRGTGETVIEGGIYLRDGSDGTTIDGFTIQNGDVVAGSRAGIYLENAGNITIENNAFVRDGEFDEYRAVLTTSGGDNGGLTVSDNSFTGWATGAYLNPGATNAEISGNVFDGNNVGVSVDGPENAVIGGNTFTNNAFEGLGLGPGDAALTVILLDNTFADNGSETGRNIGVWADGLTVSSDVDGAVLEMQGAFADITLAGNGALSVIGNDADNLITGNDGANRLAGGAGDDTLVGGLGADTLVGGDGADVFVYTDILDAGDLIVGFDANPGGDRIDLVKLFDALEVEGTERSGRVEIAQDGTNATISIDTDIDSSGFEVVLTVTNITGDLTVADHLALVA